MPKKKYQSLRVFKSDFLEVFTHVHPILPLLLWGPVAVYFIWHARAVNGLGVGQILGWGSAALLVWSAFEYVLHRYLFHFKAKSAIGKRLYFIFHGLHHDDPSDPTRLVMPPIVSLALALMFFPLFRWMVGPLAVEPFFAFFVVGYLAYDYIHFAVHHFRPRTPIGKFLKDNHMKHHFVNPESRWGVSSPLWDYICGTTGRAQVAAAKPSHAGS